GDGADVALELADGTSLDGPVAGVVHARGDLVDHQALGRGSVGAEVEHLHRQHAHVGEGVGDGTGDFAGAGKVQGREARGRDGAAQDSVLMRVAGAVVEGDL